MPLSSHFKELRRRLLTSLALLVVLFVVTFNFSEKIIVWIKNSVLTNESASLIFLSPAEALWSNITASAFVAILLSFPFFTFQIWRFISPGMKMNERRFSLIFVSSSCLLFCAGLAFAILIVLPFSIGFLLQYKTEGLTPFISIGMLLDFYVKFALAFALIFELPLVLTLLTKAGLVTPAFLSKNRKYALLLAFIIAAVLTPTTDIVNQLFMAVPMIILYEVGIIMSKIL